jgi:hypothetical protein
MGEPQAKGAGTMGKIGKVVNTNIFSSFEVAQPGQS